MIRRQQNSTINNAPRHGLLKRHAFLSITGVAFAALSVTALMAQPPFAMLSQKSWEQTLESISQLAPAQQIAELKEFRARFGCTAQEQQESAYILGRLLQANPQLIVPPSDNPKAGSIEALARFGEASQLTTLKERALQHGIDLATTISGEMAARTFLNHAIKTGVNPQQKAAAEFALAQSLLQAGELEEAIGHFKSIRTLAPDTQFAIASAFFLGDLGLRGSIPSMTPQECITLFRYYLKEVPDGRHALEIVSRLLSLANSSLPSGATTTNNDIPQPSVSAEYTPTTDDRLLFGQAYFEARQWRNALDQWKLADANLKVTQKAVCMANLGKKQESEDLLLKAISQQPSLHYAPCASLICNILTREEARQFWKRILAAGPKKADAALWNIGLRSEPPESLDCYRQLITAYPTSEFASEAAWWLFWEMAKRAPANPSVIANATVLGHEALSRYPETRQAPRFAFWLGKLYEAAKRPDKAIVDYKYAVLHYPSSYYGYRAQARLRALTTPKKHDQGWSTSSARHDVPVDWSWPAPQEIMSVPQMDKRCGKTFAELFKLHQLDECAELLPQTSEPELKAALLAALSQPLQAIASCSKDLPGSANHTTRWQLAYPLLYTKQVQEECHAKGVDPFLVHALIREESRYYHRALSRSHAIGLMQLLPGTAYGVAKRLGVPLHGTEDIYQPEINIKLGTDYLAYVLRRYNGGALFAVASYNGGPNAVQAWLRRHQAGSGGDFDYFVENIPIRETRDYVRKVFGSYWNYEGVYHAH